MSRVRAPSIAHFLEAIISFFQAIILGIVQGLTEFFPISSSAHLYFAKSLMGLKDTNPFFDLVCHMGTLFALLIFMRKEVLNVLKSIKTMSLFFLALLPLIPAYFLLKPLREAASDPAFLGYALIFTAALLFAAELKKSPVLATSPSLAPLSHTISSEGVQDGSLALFSPGRKHCQKDKESPGENKDDVTDCTDSPRECEKEGRAKEPSKKWPAVLCIGLMQTMALIPGISRSGSTIATARFMGWSWIEGCKFSFLLSIPAILGGEVLEIARGVDRGGASWSCLLGALFASFAVGLIGVRFIFWIYERQKVKPIALYCLSIGILWTLLHG